MNLFEFFVIGVYFAFITITIVAIQILNPGGEIRGIMAAGKEQTELVEEDVESEKEEEEDEEETPKSPVKDDYAMSENPMFRHRLVESEAPAPSQASASGMSSPKELDMEKVD